MVRWIRSARRHRVGRAHAEHVLANTFAERVTTTRGEPGLLFVGPDDRGIELEILVVVADDVLTVIHVMPTHYRNRTTSPPDQPA